MEKTLHQFPLQCCPINTFHKPYRWRPSSFCCILSTHRHSSTSKAHLWQGQTGIANYYNIFDISHVIGSAIIAICAAIVSLGLFFRFKAGWTASAIIRMLCAMLLAATGMHEIIRCADGITNSHMVSAMHWVAATGTAFQAKKEYNNQAGLSRSTAGWICGLLVCTAHTVNTPTSHVCTREVERLRVFRLTVSVGNGLLSCAVLAHDDLAKYPAESP